jgi:hypothetical protein
MGMRLNMAKLIWTPAPRNQALEIVQKKSLGEKKN